MGAGDVSAPPKDAIGMERQPSGRSDDYFPMPLAIMQPGTVAPVNIYIWLKSPPTFLLYKTAHTPLSEGVRARLIERDIFELYMRTEDEEACLDYVERNIKAIIRDELLPAEKACEIVYRSSARVMGDVFENPRSGKNLRRAQRMVEATVMSIMKDPDALWQMTSMASHDYYTYTHCVNASMFLIGASQDVLGITEVRRLERIGMGGLLHDVGKTVIPTEILNKPGKLSVEEFEEVKTHPPVGVELASRHRRLSAVTQSIIHGHHERLNGTGYPDSLSGERLDPVIRLSTIVDVYDALTTNRAYAPARPPYQAIRLMMNEMQGYFDRSLLRSFVKFLGPKEARMELRALTRASQSAS